MFFIYRLIFYTSVMNGGSMTASNCVVIVWLLYGYCMVRVGNFSDTYWRSCNFGRKGTKKKLIKFYTCIKFDEYFYEKHFLDKV